MMSATTVDKKASEIVTLADLNSALGTKLRNFFGIEWIDASTILVSENGKYFTYSLTSKSGKSIQETPETAENQTFDKTKQKLAFTEGNNLFFFNKNKEKVTVTNESNKGIVSGQIIRYQGMGDDTDPSVARGDLNVTVMVEHSQQFERRGDDLVTYCLINPVEAMTGCTKTVSHLSGTSIRFALRPGLQHGTEFASPNMGFKNLQGRQGNFIIVVGIEVPVVTDPDIKQELENIYSKIKNNLDKKD
jgi:hypothetical protein